MPPRRTLYLPLAIIIAAVVAAVVAGGAVGPASVAVERPADAPSASAGAAVTSALPAAAATSASSSAAATSASSFAGAQSGATPADDSSPAVVERVVYRQRADGELEAEVVYDVPETVSHLEFRFERAYHEVVAADGFERTDDAALDWGGSVDGPTYVWDGDEASPSVTIRHDATVGEPATYAGGTDDWAVVLRPATATRWRYDAREPTFEYDAAVEGEGVAGERFLVLGPHEVHERTVAGERLRLVVPDAARLEAPPERVLGSVAAASDRLRVGERSDEVTIVAAPTDAVEWEHRGLSLGPDARVEADLPVRHAPNLWVHEYVHTRQDRGATTPETEWLVEATAEYYAATVPLERGDVGFAAYRASLADGAEGAPADAVLADPSTWRSEAQYHKGALVVAAIDRRLRVATDGDATFQDVVAAWNDAETFDGDAFEAALDRLGGQSVGDYAASHATTSATPSTWDRQRHVQAFGLALADVRLGEPSVAVRDRPVADRLLAGSVRAETRVVATVSVENAGDRPGTYRVPLLVDGEVVAAQTGRLAPGEETTVSVAHSVDGGGEYAVQVGDETAPAQSVSVPESGGASDGLLRSERGSGLPSPAGLGAAGGLFGLLGLGSVLARS